MKRVKRLNHAKGKCSVKTADQYGYRRSVGRSPEAQESTPASSPFETLVRPPNTWLVFEMSQIKAW